MGDRVGEPSMCGLMCLALDRVQEDRQEDKEVGAVSARKLKVRNRQVSVLPLDLRTSSQQHKS